MKPLSNSKRPKVIISHPGKQHSPQLARALEENNLLAKVITTVCRGDELPPLWKWTLSVLPGSLAKKLETELQKRTFSGIPLSHLEQFPPFEVFRKVWEITTGGFGQQLMRYWSFLLHDRYVAHRLEKIRPDIVIGYEAYSPLTFLKAKQMGALTILDHCQIHYRDIENLTQTHPSFGQSSLLNTQLIPRESRAKQRELELVDYIFTLSKFAQKSLVNHVKNPSQRVYIHNLGVDINRLTPKSSYPSPRPFEILYVGSISNRKGLPLLLEAVDDLSHLDLHLTLIGPATEDKKYLEPWAGRFTYIPFLLHQELVEYYQRADVFVLPSYLDSWGMVVLEAMACGTPVIVTENTGSKDAVEQGGGSIIPPGNKEELKKAIARLYQSPQTVEALGKEARKIAVQYSWKKYRTSIVETILDIWENR